MTQPNLGRRRRKECEEARASERERGGGERESARQAPERPEEIQRETHADTDTDTDSDSHSQTY